MKRNFLVLLFFFSVVQAVCRGQATTVTITGTVTDEATGELLPFANVYINNSSIGTTTNDKGAYTLANLPIGNLDVAVSYLGYEPIKQTLRFEQPGRKTVLFKMRQGVELQSVVIYAKRSKKWQRQFKVVARELLGTGPFAKSCKILNPEVLRITMEDNGHLMAQSTSPLQIENRALGYLIYQDLSDFDYYENTMYYGGNTRFELLKPANEEEKNLWRTNQKTAYQGSLKQLLTSMVSDSLRESGFRVFQQVPDSLRAQRLLSGSGANESPYSIKNYLHYRIDEVRGGKLIRPGELATERYLVSGTKLEVFDLNKRGNSRYSDMPYAYSLVTLPQGYAVITPHGWVSVPMGMEIGGDLASDRFATLLPSDWERD